MENKSYYLVYTLLFTSGLASAKYYISQNARAGNAVSECELACPPVLYSQNANTVNITRDDIQDRWNLNESGSALSLLWIGYVEQYVSFLYRGCAFPIKLNSTNNTNQKKDPGQCASMCRTDFIGLQETTCHCMSTLPADKHVLLEKGCNSTCTNPSGILCGSNSMVSVYQMLQKVNDTSLGGHCLTYYSSGKERIWNQCRGSVKACVVCQQDDNTTSTTYRNSSDCSYKSWDEAMQDCLRNNSYPVNPHNNNLPTDGETLLWTGQIRSHVVFPTNDFYVKGQLPGWITLDGNLLEFAPPQENFSLHSLCEKLKTITSPPNTMTMYSLTHSSIYMPTTTEKNRIPTSTTDGMGLQFVSSTMSPVTSLPSDSLVTSENKGNSMPTLVILYTAIPTSFVVLAVLVIIMLWRRRVLPFCRRTENGFDNKTSFTTANTNLENKAPSETVQHEYVVLESLGDYTSIKEDYKHNTNEDNYDKATRFPSDKNYENYDRATRFTNKYTNSDEYDTASTSLSKLPRTYISPNVYNSLDNFGAYNHIGDIPHTVAKSDDWYNHLEIKNGENTYDTASNCLTSTQVIADDTYNKVSKKSMIN